MDPNYTRLLDDIKNILRSNPRGMTIIQLSEAMNINRNTMAKYLDVLQIGGNVEAYKIGPAKLYTVSNRIPLNAMLEMHDDGIVQIDGEMNVFAVNDAFSNLTGLQKEDLLDNRIETWTYHFEDSARIIECFSVALNGLHSELELEIVVDGSMRYIAGRFVPSTFEDGSRGASLILSDITQRKEQDLALRESEERYRLLAENLQNGLYIVQDEVVIYVNTALCDIMKLTEEEMMGRDFRSFIIEEDIEWSTSEYFQRLEGEEVPSEFIIKLKRGDGEIIPVKMSAGVFEYRGHISTFGTVKDLSQALRAEKSLAITHETLLGILDSLESPVYVVDPMTFKIIHANNKIIDIFGEIEGKICWQVFHASSGGPCDKCSHLTQTSILEEDDFEIGSCLGTSELTKDSEYKFTSKKIVWSDFRPCRLVYGIPLK